jgi:hypothetical protein
MTGLVPVIHAVRLRRGSRVRDDAGHERKRFIDPAISLGVGVDDRDKPGHDGEAALLLH